MALSDYLRLIVKYRLLLAAGVVVGLAVGVLTVMSMGTTYTGNVTFFVSSVGEGTVNAANAGDQFATRRVNSYLALLETERLRQMIIDDTGSDLPMSELGQKISGTGNLNTVLLSARVEDADRAQALAIAESLSREFPELVAEVERPAVGAPTVRLEVVSGPSVRQNPVSYRWILATRVLAGLAAAAAIACVRELTDNRLQSIDRALSMAKAPLLGLVTYDRNTVESPLVLDDDLGSVPSEEYRQLRTNLQFVNADRRAKVILVTSSVPKEGKSTTAANLAIAIARTGQRVVLVDGDLRNPMLGRMFGIEQSIGLVDVVRGRAALGDVIQRWGSFDLSVLPAGASTTLASELLGTVATSRLIHDLRLRFDTVIIDSPPLVPVTDASIVATLADGVVVLVRPDRVTKGELQRSLGNLERVNANVLGIVGTMMPERSSPYVTDYKFGATSTDADADEPHDLQPLSLESSQTGENRRPSLLEDALWSTRKQRR